MRELFEFAEVLASVWRIANPNDRLPTSHGILDAALYKIREELPDRYREMLSFGNTRVGFRCYELPDILYCAQANLLTSEPNPTYLTTTIQIDEGAARRFLRRHGLNVDMATDLGRRLKEATDEARKATDRAGFELA